jgi:CheY-like chemotaxis protein
LKPTLCTEPRSFPQRSALVVGPEPDFAATVATILPDWKIERVRDNVAALAFINARAFDLVLTGENTSGQADVELLRRIRLVRPHTRLIIITNESTPSDVIASMREHAFSYFSKPLCWTSITGMVKLAAEGPCWDDGIEVLSATPAWIRLAARCDLKTADRLLQFFNEIADLPEPEKGNVAAALREMLLNADRARRPIRSTPIRRGLLSKSTSHGNLPCERSGEGFALDEIRHAAIANPPDDPIRHHSYRDAQGLRPGGFGVLLTRSLVDEVIYSEKGNEVLLVKYADSRRRRTA